MIKLFNFFLLLSIVSNTCVAQIKVTKLDKKDIPVTIKYTGHIINAVKYTDSDGQHLVITTETGITEAKKSESGDVSPPDMKIIMHEGLKKYAVRGTKKVKVSDEDFEGGKYTFDEAFKTGPEAFRQYAADMWKKNLMQVWQ